MYRPDDCPHRHDDWRSHERYDGEHTGWEPAIEHGHIAFTFTHFDQCQVDTIGLGPYALRTGSIAYCSDMPSRDGSNRTYNSIGVFVCITLL